MKVVCDRAALQDAVSLISSVVPPRSSKPILQCVRMVATPGLLTLHGTDLDVGLRIGLDQVEVAEPGEVIVPADKVDEIVRACSDSSLTLEVRDNHLNIRGADAHFKLNIIDTSGDVDPWPDRDPAEGVTADCVIAGGVLRHLIERTIFAAAADHNVRYAIRGALYERKDRKVRFVATDGKRLAMADGAANSGKGESRCILPKKPLHLITRLVDDPDQPIRISIGQNSAVFAIGEGDRAGTSSPGAMLWTKLEEGTFPPYEDVVPRDLDKKITSNRDALSSAIRRAALLTNAESRGVRLCFGDNRLTLRSRSPEMGEAEINVDVAYDGDPIEVGFSPNYITDVLKVAETSDVIIELKTPQRPGIFRCGQDFTYVVMPLQV